MGFLRSLGVVLAGTFRNMRNTAEHPTTLTFARIHIIAWGVALLTAINAVGTEAVSVQGWSWLYVFDGPLIILDFLMAHSAFLGYARLKAEAKARAEFNTLIAQLRKDAP